MIAFAMLLCGDAPAFAEPVSNPTQDAVAGARVFGAKGCVKCHSIDGLGGKIGPDLARIQRNRSFYDLAAALWNHLPGMAERMREFAVRRPALSPAEAGDLIAFLYTLDYFDAPGNPAAGKRLFAEKKCIACHQVNGVGGVVGPELDSARQYASAMFVAAAMWNHGPNMTEAMRERGVARPSFGGNELGDLIAYLKSAGAEKSGPSLNLFPGDPERGRRLFTDHRCIECHSAGGGGGKIGPDLAERAVHLSMTQFAQAMWNKAPAMTAAMKQRRIAVPRLDAQHMADIVAYLYSVRYFARPGNAERGRALAAQKGCLACHGLDTEKIGPALSRVKGLDSPETVVAAMWNHSFIGARASEQQKSLWPQFRPEEMADLAAFLQTVGRGKT